MERSLEPELLDALPPSHPDALHSRRDLRWTNRLMRNHAWFTRTLPKLVKPGERVLELGAGTGELGLQLARCGVTVDGLDIWPRPESWLAGHHWHQADAREFTGWTEYTVVIGNLIFHQFADDDLAIIGQKLKQVRLVMACEPLRRRLSQIAFRTVAPLFGANHVTLHDAHVSIAAGFQNRELSDALGLADDCWTVDARPAPVGAYHLIALHRP